MGYCFRRPVRIASVLVLLGGLIVTTNALGVAAEASRTAGPSRLWATRYGDPGFNTAYSLAVSPDGSRVFVTGEANSGSDYVTLAYDSTTGAVQWAATYNGTGNGFDDARALRLNPSGSLVFVTGTSVQPGPVYATDYATVAYDAVSGAQLWVARYDGPSEEWDAASDLTVSPDGSAVFVTGKSTGMDGSYDIATVGYSVADGAQLWVARYEGPAGDLDAGNAISASPDGTTVAITGYATSTDTSGDLVTIAYDSANGTRRWISSYDGPQHSWDEGRGIAISPDDSTVVVTGYSLTIGAVSDYVTLAHDLDDGSQLWSARYNGTGVGHDVAEVVQLSPDGSRVFITGSSKGEGITDDYATLSYATRTGVQQWASRYNGPADNLDFADALVVSADGSLVYVTGGSTGIGTNLDYATIVYRAGSGRQLQVIRQGRDGADAGIDVGVSSDGSQLFVTGVVQDKLGQTFYGTLAYGL